MMMMIAMIIENYISTHKEKKRITSFNQSIVM